MFNIVRKSIEWGHDTLMLETGKIARQADGAVVATYGETSVLATVVFAKKPGPLPRAPEPDFVGWDAPNRFRVGYGLDHAGALRGLPDVCALD